MQIHVATTQAASDFALERQQSHLPSIAPTNPDAAKLSDTIVLLAAKTVVGEMEYVSEERLPLASVTATTNVKAMQVLYDDLDKLLERQPTLGYKVMRNVAKVACKSVSGMNKMFSNFGNVLDMYKSARQTSFTLDIQKSPSSSEEASPTILKPHSSSEDPSPVSGEPNARLAT
ncbi:hypothetical protein T484DRAFT_1838952 [Baffinella frigidus]|nr:hypothetical protein T484DRAFT_1838952 [Cryptophyta sp. CCMP2293]